MHAVWQGLAWRDRLGAAAVHLSASVLVALAAAALVWGVWYPEPFWVVSGGSELFTLLVVVDVIVGPLITLAVFDKRKGSKHLARDLLVVCLLQVSALAYGLHTVWLARPAYVVFAVDRFQVLPALDLNAEDLAQAQVEFQKIPWWGPRWVASAPWSDPKEHGHAIDVAMKTGVDLGLKPVRWRSYESQTTAVLARAKPLKDLMDKDTEAVMSVVRDAGVTPEELVYVPIMARELGWVAVLNKTSAKPVGYLPFGGLQ